MALWQPAGQTHSTQSFDTKAGAVLTVAAAVTGLFGASAAGSSDLGSSAWVTVSVMASSAIVLAAVGWTVLAFYKTVKPRRRARGPDPHRLIEVAEEHEESRVRLSFARAIPDSLVENEDAVQEQARWFRRALPGAIASGGGTTVGFLAIGGARTVGYSSGLGPKPSAT